MGKKKRGKDKPTLSLAGRRKMEKAARKKERRRINRQMGRAGVKPNQKNPASRNIKNIPTISVLFVEQTPGGASGGPTGCHQPEGWGHPVRSGRRENAGGVVCC